MIVRTKRTVTILLEQVFDKKVWFLPPSCEPAAIQLLSAWRIPDTDQTFQKSPGNKKFGNKHMDISDSVADKKKRKKNLVIQLPCFHLKIHHPVVFYFLGTDLQ